MNDVLNPYVNPCVSNTHHSLESSWLYPSDYGEDYPPPSDELLYPRLVPVYNGKQLDVKSEFVHASLSGISIKHYYGMCYKEEEEPGEYYFEDVQPEDYVPFEYEHKKKESMLTLWGTNGHSTDSKNMSTSSGFDNRDNPYVEGQPLCTIPRINYRNSFWNIHRPELCKLTWGQKYVGSAVVTEHLHEHLMYHGRLCAGFHTAEDRAFLLNKELDEYVRLKVLQNPKKLPPDEPYFDFRMKVSESLRCKEVQKKEVQRFLDLSDDEDDRKVCRSKAEFCLTIGKHIRRPPMVEVVEALPEEYITPELSSYGEEEGGSIFFYNWLLYGEEEPYGEPDKYDSVSISDSETGPLVQPCPPLIMDEFCRAAGKVDFSDVRCDPDF